MCATCSMPSSADNFTTRPTVVIYGDGDVILQITNGGIPNGSLRVSYHALALGSSVFRAMFSDRWTGERPTSRSPQAINLFDDNFGALALLCRLLHSSANIPDKVSCADLANFTVICDKYDCLRSTRGWVRAWCADLLTSAETTSELEKLVLVTYVFDLPKEFRKVTRALIQYQTFNMNVFSAAHGHQLIPQEAFRQLHQAEVHSFNHMQRVLVPRTTLLFDRNGDELINMWHAITQGQEHNLYCEGADNALEEYFGSLDNLGLYPARLQTLHDIYRQANHINNDFNLHPYPCAEHYSDCMAIVLKDAAQNMLLEVNRVFTGVYGLCLDCIRKKVSGQARICREPHGPLGFQ